MKKVAICLMITLLLLLAGCKGKVASPYIYDDADKYSVGSGSVEVKDIDKIEIDWLTGNVIVKESTNNKVEFSEVVDQNTEEKYQLHYYVDGTTLKIKFAESMKLLTHSFEIKDLTIQMPEFNGDLEVDVISSNFNLTNNVVKSLNIDSISGRVKINDLTTDNLKIDSISGEVDIRNSSLKNINLDSTSGDIRFLETSFDDLAIDSISAKVDINCINEPLNMNIDTISGNVLLTLLENSAFKVSFDSINGDFDCEFKSTKEGNIYTINDGKNRYNVETVSGNLDIYKK